MEKGTKKSASPEKSKEEEKALPPASPASGISDAPTALSELEKKLEKSKQKLPLKKPKAKGTPPSTVEPKKKKPEKAKAKHSRPSAQKHKKEKALSKASEISKAPTALSESEEKLKETKTRKEKLPLKKTEGKRASKKKPKAKGTPPSTAKPEEKKLMEQMKPGEAVLPETPKVRGVESVIRKLVLGTSTVLGVGYVLPNIAVVILLGYVLSLSTISSLQNITYMSGLILFLLASIVLIVVGFSLIIGGVRYYKKNPPPQRTIFLGVMLGSFYLLCLGAGSALLSPQISLSIALLIISPILVMVSAAVHMVPSFRFKLIGSVTGIAGGISLAYAILNLQILKLAFGVWPSTTAWNIPFPGPFMSMTILEGVAVVAGSIALSVHSLLAGRKERPVSYAFLSMTGLVYGVSVFIGSLILSFNLLDIIWKAPWDVSPLHGLPKWILNTTVFWSASLVMLEIGGILLILCSCIGFAFVAKEFSQLYAK